MLDFSQIAKVTLFFECSGRADGAYTNDPRDPGGETKYGISKRAHPNVDIKNLTEAQAIELYHTEYFATTGIIRINDMVTATKIFDIGVNEGPGTAIKMAQKAINFAYGFNKVGIDGNMGQMTASAINSMTPEVLRGLVNRIKLLSRTRHMGLVALEPAQFQEDKDGWLRRDYWPYWDDNRVWPYLPLDKETWPVRG